MGTRLPEGSFFVSPGIAFPRFFGLSDWWCLNDGHIVSKQWAMTFSGLRLCNGQCFSSETGFRLASFLKIRNCKNNTNSTTLYGDPKRVPSRKVERVPRAYLVFLNLTSRVSCWTVVTCRVWLPWWQSSKDWTHFFFLVHPLDRK